jgi:hypothetical protein
MTKSAGFYGRPLRSPCWHAATSGMTALLRNIKGARKSMAAAGKHHAGVIAFTYPFA